MAFDLIEKYLLKIFGASRYYPFACPRQALLLDVRFSIGFVLSFRVSALAVGLGRYPNYIREGVGIIGTSYYGAIGLPLGMYSHLFFQVRF